MSKHLQRDMDNVHEMILALFGDVEEMIQKAMRSLAEQRWDFAEDVIASDNAVDMQEVRIEEECLKMLALHHPMAGNLRRIATVIKINSDLERIADLACNIAERSLCLRDFPEFPFPEGIREMVGEATEMVRLALDAFVNTDVRAAQEVIVRDHRVDQQNREVIAVIKELMRQEPGLVDPALHCFSAARHVERIADLAENIAEDVIYLVEGTIIRHRHTSYSRTSPNDADV